MSRRRTSIGILTGAVMILLAQAGPPTGVSTAGYNNLRDDRDPEEPALSPSTVGSAGFGKLFSTQLSGAVYA
jgi:hypothetical protein